MRGKRADFLKAGIVVAALIAVVALIDSVHIVDQCEQAVVTRFGDPVKVICNPVKGGKELARRLKQSYREQGVQYSEGPGLRIKLPFVESVHRFDRRLLAWDGYPEQIPTKDKKYIWVDTTARWFIEDPLKFLQTVRNEDTALARLDDIIDSTVRDKITNHPLVESVRNSNRKMRVSEAELESQETTPIEKGREIITKEICREAGKQCEEYGIRLVDVLIKGVNYVDSVKEKVFGRMIAERKRIAEKYRSEGEGEAQKIRGRKELELKTIMSEAYRQAEIKKGEGDAEAARIYAEAYGKDPDFYQFWKTLQLYEEAFKSSKGKTVLLLGTDNELFKYLKSFAPLEPPAKEGSGAK